MQVDWKEVSEVYAETLDRCCNALWQTMHPGENNWEYPDQVVGQVIAKLDKLRQIEEEREALKDWLE